MWQPSGRARFLAALGMTLGAPATQIGNPDLLALVTKLDINTPEEYEMAVKRFALL